MGAAEYNERLEYYLKGLMVGSDPKLLSGVGNISNKLLRIDVDDDRVTVSAEEQTGGV